MFGPSLDDDEVICEVFCGAGHIDVKLKGNAWKRINPDNPDWLTDECIDLYLWLVQERGIRLCKANLDVKPVYFFHTSFMQRLLQGDPNISRYGKKVRKHLECIKQGADLFDLGILGIPFNIGNSHWLLVIVDFVRHEFRYYDSFHHPGVYSYLFPVREYLLKELSMLEEIGSRSKEWITMMKVRTNYMTMYLRRWILINCI